MSIILWLTPYFLVIGALAWTIHRFRNRGRRTPLTDKLLREPAHSLKRQQEAATMNGLIYLCGSAVLPSLFYIVYLQGERNPTLGWLALIFGAISTLFCMALALRNLRTSIQLHQGIDAEVATGQELSVLMRDGAWVFHDIPYPYGNIDHVIVSAGGIFAVETKGYSKTKNTEDPKDVGWRVSVKDGVLHFPHGRTKKPMEQARRHARWLADEIKRRFQLEPPIQPVVALPGWLIEGGWDQACWVINPKGGNALRKAVTKPTIPGNQVTMIAGWLEDLSRSVEPSSKRLD